MATPTTLPASFVSGAVLEAAQLNNLRGAFRVLQIVQTVKTDTFSTTSATFTDVTGLTATITPSSTSSKILILGDVKLGVGTVSDNSCYLRVNGGNASTYIGDTAGNRVRTANFLFLNTSIVDMSRQAISQNIVYLDSPSTTSATTYAIQARVGTGTAFVNRSSVDTDSTVYGRTASSITVMEISA